MLSKKKSPYLTQFIISIFFTLFASFQIYHKISLEKTSTYTMQASYETNRLLLNFLAFKDSYKQTTFSKKEVNQMIYQINSFNEISGTPSISYLNFSLLLYTPHLESKFNSFIRTNENFDYFFKTYFYNATQFAKIEQNNLDNLKNNKNTLPPNSLKMLLSQEEAKKQFNLSSFTNLTSFLQNRELLSLYIKMNHNSDDKLFKNLSKLNQNQFEDWWKDNYASSFGNDIPEPIVYLHKRNTDWEYKNLKFWLQEK